MVNAGSLVRDTFYSPLLEEDRQVNVILPDGYNSLDIEKRYPTVYFLHGGGTGHDGYTEIENAVNQLISQGDISDIIIVKPYGGAYSYWANSPFFGQIEDFVISDLIAYIDSTYHTISNRDARFIMGHSMGGHCIRIMLKHPEKFRAAAAHNGNIHLRKFLDIIIPQVLIENNSMGPYDPRAGDWTNALYLASLAFSPNADNPLTTVDYPINNKGKIDEAVVNRWMENDPATQASQYSSGFPVDVYFDSGTSDIWHPLSVEFEKIIRLTEIPYVYSYHLGDHTTNLQTRFSFSLAFFDSLLNVSTSSVNDNLSSGTLPDVISIRQNFPNPFNPATEIRFDVFNTRWVRVDIYDLNGKIINELMSQVCQPGTYRIIWNGRNSKDQQIPSGVYFYNVQCGTVIKTGKMILLR
ncbi:MAG: T9SS type A sorting domain-containing protein [Candidatus Marinimicrobia bacterium]|nr:T9SS type A sorting domain-containing protein [Candidatus Neomarinimicrobiota bacterium]